ncbi:MAG: bifunctional alpha,alpha-trehalose-phosphate synthase (UDP-forming)/trehalose-phosphatase [Candidatus Lokiarchaeota archaeon]|nr:bifunctional alpha,alpha-trehalose-phosphate synthase (UDP-forming)/trehalose-phosphatase [Candidatus Lokiarchaeota archaeon]
MERRLVIISNRLPVSVKKENNKITYTRSLGGLTTGLESFHKSHNGIWIGWPGIVEEKVEANKNEIKEHLKEEYNCYPIFFTQEEKEKFYEGFCNKTIWPLFHYFIEFTTFEDELWNFYKIINNKFFRVILEIVKSDDILWIQDYHLMLLPNLIRNGIPDATIGYFLHIPFPSYEIFRLLPWREEILEGLLGSDLIGFHTYDYERHFLSSVRRLLSIDFTMNQINLHGRNIKVDTFPMGIDYDKFQKIANTSSVKNKAKDISKEIGHYRVILSIDRMDYTKGIKLRLEAFELFLDNYPNWREKVILMFVIAPSRSDVEEYQNLKKEIDELVGKINGKFSKIGWNPILYRHKPLNIEELVALYMISDIILITPIRDGMNLIVKEYIASKLNREGIPILSETAGAAKQLFESIIVNTNNKNQMIEAINSALTMSRDEKIDRMSVMQKRIKNYDVLNWAEDILENLLLVKEKPQDKTIRYLNHTKKEELYLKYNQAKKRLIILDYDGTLVQFYNDPKEAKPDDEIIEILKTLIEDKKNRVAVVSGRNKETLSEWFKNLDIILIAEHGLWIKHLMDEWNTIDYLKNNWKEDIRPILEKYVNRTPGSFIEEKEFCLVWHYRKVESELADIRTRELVDFLKNFTHGEDLTILDGNKVVEIKNALINKGIAISNYLLKDYDPEFIFVVGDDITDEDMFELINSISNSFTIKIGFSRTNAKYNIFSVEECRNLLKEMIKK